MRSRRQRGALGGSTEVTIGKILGIVATALLALGLVVIVLFVFGGIIAGVSSS